MKAVQAEDEGEDDDQREFERYAKYLERQRKCLKITERSREIDDHFDGKFADLIGSEQIKIFHVSSQQYMKWISKDKIKFDSQASLSPALTGIPRMRQHLFSLPANHSYKDMRNQVFNEVSSTRQGARHI